MSYLSDAVDWLRDELEGSAGETITVTDGGQSTEAFVATPTATQFEMIDDEGQVVGQTQYRDWLIDPADLAFDGERRSPTRDMVIRWATGGVTKLFRVVAPSGDSVWRWTDSHERMMRVHTVYVGDE